MYSVSRYQDMHWWRLTKGRVVSLNLPHAVCDHLGLTTVFNLVLPSGRPIFICRLVFVYIPVRRPQASRGVGLSGFC